MAEKFVYEQLQRVFTLSKREIIIFFTLNYLDTRQTAISGNEVYQLIKASLPHDRHSRAYVYDTLKKMEEMNWLKSLNLPFDQKPTILYSLTEQGKTALLEFLKQNTSHLDHIQTIVNNFLYDITGNGQFQKMDRPLDRKTLKYLNKLINVNDMIRFMVLFYLEKYGESHGYEIYRHLQERYGWQSNDGYFYQILRDMDRKELWLSSRWINEDRKVRMYSITDTGRFHLERIGHNVVQTLINARECIKTLITLFGSEERELEG